MLIKCPDCGKEVSSKAKACPNCGCPLDVIEEKEVEKYAEYTAGLVDNINKYISILQKKNALLNKISLDEFGKDNILAPKNMKVHNPLKIGGIVAGAYFLLALGNWIANGISFSANEVVTLFGASFFLGIIAVPIVLAINKSKRKKIAAVEAYLGEWDEVRKYDKELNSIPIPEIPKQYRNEYALRKIANILENNSVTVELAIEQYEKQTSEEERRNMERKQVELLEKQNKLIALSGQIAAIHAKATISHNMLSDLRYLSRRN